MYECTIDHRVKGLYKKTRFDIGHPLSKLSLERVNATASRTSLAHPLPPLARGRQNWIGGSRPFFHHIPELLSSAQPSVTKLTKSHQTRLCSVSMVPLMRADEKAGRAKPLSLRPGRTRAPPGEVSSRPSAYPLPGGPTQANPVHGSGVEGANIQSPGTNTTCSHGGRVLSWFVA